jgi:hypothetical protein
MFVWVIVEPILMILAAIFIITQVAVPAWKNTPTFPLIRQVLKRRRVAEEKMRVLKATKEVQKLEKSAAVLEAELHEKPKRRKPTNKGE